MPIPTIRRPERFVKPAAFALVLTLFSLAAPDASAQSSHGGIRGYYERFYGQDFYGNRHPSRFTREGYRRQDFGPIYGPVQIYSRQYDDQYGYATDRPFGNPQSRGLGGYEIDPRQFGNRP